jgi:hypothetical protein
VPWPREKFDFFRAWLTTGGLGIIKVLINEELSKGVGGLPLTEANELVRNSIVRCADVMESSM